jgi:hypothetical protein
MNDLIFPGQVFSGLKTLLLSHSTESAAILVTTPVKTKSGFRILVNDIHLPTDEAYLKKTGVDCQLKPEFLAPIVKKAKLNNKGLVFVHTHPGSINNPRFSPIDDKGEKTLCVFLEKRNVLGPHIALVVGPNGCTARFLGTFKKIRVMEVGPNIWSHSNEETKFGQIKQFDRQIRAFGPLGQHFLRDLKLGIVGLGGTGSLVIQQLAYLGVKNYLLIDPDVIEVSNLNRVVGANKKDLNRPKVDIANRLIKFVNNEAEIKKVKGSILDAKVALLLKDVDFIFCCTDSHGSRAILNQLSYQYFIPCIDIGVSITAQNHQVTHITGRTQMLSPGLGCLTCSGTLDPDAIRYDLMTSFQRQKDPYFIGDNIPAPSVISLNSTMVSFAITMFLGFVTGVPFKARFQTYDGITGKLRPASAPIDPVCIVCSPRGAFGRGDEWPLPARQNE